MLECSIPEHLRRQRTCPTSTPANYNPPFPAYCARFPVHVKDLVFAIIGAQYPAVENDHSSGISTIKHFVGAAPDSLRPSFWEVASVTDKKGAFNIAVLAYWPSVELYRDWEINSGFQDWWRSPSREEEDHGWFLEVLKPPVDRFETVFSNNSAPEGAANMQESISGEMLEHAYWGSMRDRLAVAQADAIKGEKWQSPPTGDDNLKNGTPSNLQKPRRIQIPGKQNLCVIRSGQDWSGTLPDERKLYLETMHPVLIEGMDFLRDHGSEVGCYSMNLWDVVDTDTHKNDKERTFGLGYFDDLSSLEFWSKSHQTHINIFGGFLMYAKKLNNVLSLRLFHEILILEPGQQHLEYIGCHDQTSMLVATKEATGK